MSRIKINPVMNHESEKEIGGPHTGVFPKPTISAEKWTDKNRAIVEPTIWFGLLFRCK